MPGTERSLGSRLPSPAEGSASFSLCRDRRPGGCRGPSYDIEGGTEGEGEEKDGEEEEEEHVEAAPGEG